MFMILREEEIINICLIFIGFFPPLSFLVHYKHYGNLCQKILHFTYGINICIFIQDTIGLPALCWK